MNKEKHAEAVKQNMIVTVVFWCLFTVFGVAGMLLAASRKTIVIADSAVESAGGMEQEFISSQTGSTFRMVAKGTEKCLYIPIEKGIKAENVTVENRYMDHQLWIHIIGGNLEFYKETGGYGNLTTVVDSNCDIHEDGVFIQLDMTGVYEYRTTLDNDILKIAYYDPYELYNLIVVIDPAGGGDETGQSYDRLKEKDVALEVARKLQAMPEKDGVKIYYTRQDDVSVNEKKRIDLCEAVYADAYIRLGVGLNKDDKNIYGVEGLYNSTFFIPDLGNVELADIVTRNVTISAGNKAIGLWEAPEESILQKLNVPAMEVHLGFLSNEKESDLLRREDYAEELADGLAKAIEEVYTMEKE